MRAADSNGFTLVEMLVALAVATLAVTLFMSVLGDGLLGSTRVQRYSDATILAESALESMGVVAPLRDGDSASVRKDPFLIETASRIYGEGGIGAAYQVPYVVTATVSWNDGRGLRSLSLSTLRLGPPR